MVILTDNALVVSLLNRVTLYIVKNLHCLASYFFKKIVYLPFFLFIHCSFIPLFFFNSIDISANFIASFLLKFELLYTTVIKQTQFDMSKKKK